MSRSGKRRVFHKRIFTSILILCLGVFIGFIIDLSLTDSTHSYNNENREPIANTNVGDVEQLQVNVTSQMTEIVEKDSAAIVGVTNLTDRIDHFNATLQPSSTGSGVIYKRDGKYAYIVTNNHVVKGADKIEVVMHDNSHVSASLLGHDLYTDLAILRIPSDNVEKVIPIGKSKNIRVGEPVITIGNPLGLRFAGSVTKGIISGKQRSIPIDFNDDGRIDWQAEVLQTDAAINPGNSGGALINMEGQLIGINSMKISEDVVEGIGFAIPIDFALPIIHELEANGKVERPYMGMEIYSLSDLPQAEWKNVLQLSKQITGGVYIWRVDNFSPADDAGVKRLDVITKIDDIPVNNVVDLRKILYQQRQIGDTIQLTVYRYGTPRHLKLKLKQHP